MRVYGAVVLSVKVSVLLYVPVRSASPAATACLNATGTVSFEVGPVHVFTTPSPCSGSGARTPR